MALICASSYSYIECVISQVKIAGFKKKLQADEIIGFKNTYIYK